MTNASLLLIDDDRELTEMLAEYLGAEGFRAEIVGDGAEALARIGGARTFDLVILDVMLPSINGFDVLRRVRESNATPVIMLTARGDDVDCVLGLELGADDYLAKPFNPRQLVARIRAVLRRSTAPAAASPIALGGLSLDPAAFQAELNGSALSLTGTEYRLLETLAQAAGQVQSRETLTERVLGRPLQAYDRSVDTHVSNLRRKLAAAGAEGVEIRNIRGAGYVLIASAAATAGASA
jgi:DNA-binding response OmpR family regulator